MKELRIFFRCILWFFLSVILFGYSCTFNYDESENAEKLSEDIPDSILYNSVHTAMNNSMPVFRIYADKAEMFNEKNITRLYSIRFEEFDDELMVITHGTADEAIVDNETEDATITGNILFYSSEEEATVTAEFLDWNNENKELTSPDDSLVQVKRDSGTEISGYGFNAVGTRMEVYFDKDVSGVYVDTDDDENGENTGDDVNGSE